MSILSYVKTVWVDKLTALGPTKLNKIEDGIEVNNIAVIDLDQSNKYVLLTYISSGLFAADTVIAFDDKKEILIELEATELDPTTPVEISVDNQTTKYLVKVGDVLNSLLVSDGQGNKFTLHRDGSIALIPQEAPSKTDEIEYNLSIQSQQTIVPAEGSSFGDKKIDGASLKQEAINGNCITTDNFVDGGSMTISVASQILKGVSNGGNPSIVKYEFLSDLEASKEHYFSFKIRTNFSGTVGELICNLDGAISGTNVALLDQSNPVSGEWYQVNIIATIPNDYVGGTVLKFFINGGVLSGDDIEIDGVEGLFTIPIENTILDGLIAPLIAKKISVYFESLKSIENPEIKITNQNIFNKDTAVDNFFIIAGGGSLSPDDRFYASDFIKVIADNDYILSADAASAAAGHAFYDSNKVYISGVTTQSFTIPVNAIYVRVSYRKTNQDIETAQFELGTTKTIFIAHANSSKKYPNQILRDLPNSVADYIDTVNNILHKLVSDEYILQASDIISLVTTGTNQDYALTNLSTLTNVKPFVTPEIGQILVAGKPEVAGTAWDVVGTSGMVASFANTTIRFIVAKGTYADLAAAQVDLAGTVLQYELIEEIITKNIDSDGIAFAYKNMTIEIIQDNGFSNSWFAKHAQNDPETVKLLGENLEKTQKELDIYTNLKPVYQFDTDDSTTIDLSILPKGSYNIECERKVGASTSRNIVSTGYVGRALTPSGSASGQTDLIIPQNNCSDDETSDRYISRLLVNESTHFGDIIQISANGTNIINRQVRKADLLIEGLPVGYTITISKL